MLKKMCDANAIHGRISEYAILCNIYSIFSKMKCKRINVLLESMQQCPLQKLIIFKLPAFYGM
jgi:hypothetical protein